VDFGGRDDLLELAFDVELYAVSHIFKKDSFPQLPLLYVPSGGPPCECGRPDQGSETRRWLAAASTQRYCTVQQRLCNGKQAPKLGL